MIWVTRLDGSEIVINADLIETMEPTPDSVITLVDGTKYLVKESISDIIAKIQDFRAAIVSMADGPADPGATIHHLASVGPVDDAVAVAEAGEGGDD